MGQTPHYFIAIPIEEKLREIFSNWQRDLQQELSYKIWPHQEDLHITLKFLGAVEDDQLNKLREALKSVSQGGFSTTVGSLGIFGKSDRPRVLWAGVEKSSPLEELYKEIETLTNAIGFPKENRPYRPHITLAKKWNSSSDLANVLMNKKENYKLDNYHMDVEEFVLYQIFPSKSPKYERVETYQLGG